MAIPSKYRDVLAAACGGRLVITAHPYERCLSIYPEPLWREVSAKVSALPNSQKAVRSFQRRLLGNAAELELDSNGRVLLPAMLRDFARLDKKLVLVGLNDKAELWSEEAWNALLDENDDDAPLPDELLSLSF